MSAFKGELFDDLGVFLEVLERARRHGDQPGVAHFGVPGDELLLAVQQRLGGAAVPCVDATSLLLLGDRVGVELHQVAFDPSSRLMCGHRTEVHGHRPGDPAAGQERFQPRWRDR